MFNCEFWFVIGSQFLYGEETLAKVEEDARKMAEGLNAGGLLPASLVYKDTVKTAEGIRDLVLEANHDPDCAGLVVFCHTFSPSKMWINGLTLLQKPYLHFHSQFNLDIPNEAIDMDYMNLHQSAHGDREHAFMAARLRLPRKIVAGHWQDPEAQKAIGKWMRAAAGAAFSRTLKVMRFGDNMREVGVTEGDKVGAQIDLGWQVNTWPVGWLAERIRAVPKADIKHFVEGYKTLYTFRTDDLESVRWQAAAELAMRQAMDEEECEAFTNTFEDLYGMEQLPGLATQDLMRQGYGYGGEGDWKVSAMTALMKFMSLGLPGGTSFMEDYTYDMRRGLTLGAHMLEVCPTLAADKPAIEVHKLGIGGKRPPARLVFEGAPGPAILVSLIDMGGRLRLIVQDIDCVKPPQTMPNLPTARVMWKAKPSQTVGAHCWMLAGGSHHSVLSQSLDAEIMRDFARIMKLEFVHITRDTTPEALEEKLFLTDIAYRLTRI